MNVLHLGWSDPSKFCGGLDVHVSKVVERLNGMGLNVDYRYMRKSESQNPLDSAFQIAKQIKKADTSYDIVHTHDWMGAPTGLKMQKDGCKWVSTVHSLPGHHRKLEKAALRKPDKLTAVSQLLAGDAANEYGVDPEVVRNGFNQIEEVHKPQNLSLSQKNFDEIYLFAGRHAQEKNPKLLIYCFSKYLAENPGAVLVMSGKGYLTGRLKALAERIGIRENVLFPGFIDRNSLGWLYEKADAFVHPSEREPFGLSISEALTFGTPVLAGHSGVFEIADTGYIQVEPKTDSLLEGMDQSSRMSFSPYAPRNWIDVAEDYISKYREF